jgi:hypothetical protein
MRPSPARGLPALVTVLALAACGSKKEPPPAPGSASAAEPEPAAKPAAATTTPPAAEAPAAEAPAAPPIAGGALPEACNEYRAMIQRLAQCGDALPQATRENLQKHFEQQWAGWAKLPDQDKQTLAGICKSSSATVKEAAKDICDW